MNTRMIRRTGALLLPLVAAATLTTVGATAPADATPLQPASSGCGWTPANNGKIVGGFDEQGVNIRTGPSTSCSIRGEGYESHSVQVRCEWSGNGYDWFYLTDQTTGVTGWSVVNFIGLSRQGVPGC